MEDREYFLLRPRLDLQGCTASPANYADSAVGTQALWQHIRVPVWSEGSWRAHFRNTLVPKGVGRFWTAHSPRVTMASWAMAAGVEHTHIQLMGRWKVDMAR
eukprot:2679883-Amphidinium_carterae.1